jgi:gp45 sliding clamp, C terminal
MELSNFTMQVLKNFASINSNIVIKPGSTITTKAEANNVVAVADVAETFPIEFGIYDLSEFLSVIGLVDSPRIKFEEHYAIIGDQSGRASIKYFFSDTDNLTTPKNLIKMPDTNISFTLDQSTLNNLKRAASALGHSEISITGTTNLITLSVLDKDNATSNKYSIDVDGKADTDNFKFILDVSNIKVIPADYKVEISSRLISQFTSINLEKEIKYWVALEKSSSYN